MTNLDTLKYKQECMKRKNLGIKEGIRRRHTYTSTPAQFREANRTVATLLSQRDPVMTLEEIAKIFGVTRERVRQINAKLGLPSRLSQIRLRQAEEAAKKAEDRANTLIPHQDALPEYRVYVSAKARCNNPNLPSFKNYGGRGIEFRFTSFIEFFDEVGNRPEGKKPSGRALYSINRKDNNGHYEPGNVEWATYKEQCAPGARRKKSSIKDLNTIETVS